MVASKGLVGLRPAPAEAARVTSPPYDVIKPGTPLEAALQSNDASVYHVILGSDPKSSLDRLLREGLLVVDDTPAYYVYQQRWDGGERTGVFAALAVTPYEDKQVIRHEKTFDDKVAGRIALARTTEHTFGPVFVLTRAPIRAFLERAKADEPVYRFTSTFDGGGDLDGIDNAVWRVEETSELGRELGAALATQPVYIADGHHRYHAALKNEQSHFLSYIAEDAKILAYNRVVRGVMPFADIIGTLDLEETPSFETPPKHHFALYHEGKSYRLAAKDVPSDVVGRLDCAILERELYPKLGLRHDMIADAAHFDYYSEAALDQMKAVVDRGDYDVAIALAPVSLEELMAVADAGLTNSEIVMPEKSTFFAPKILTGLVVLRH
ncbi:MAG: DUF1015 family protein [Myxococcota bacterium]